MIEILLKQLEESNKPDRELDCHLHECLTGQINLCKDNMTRTCQEKVGRMLIEHGSEILWTDVPRYTKEADAALKLIDQRKWLIQLAYIPPDIRRLNAYAAMAQDKEGECNSMTDVSLAWAVCLLAVRIALRRPQCSL